MPFAVSIATLSLFQGVLVALPAGRPAAWAERFRSPWWALVPALSIGVVVGVIAWEGGTAEALTWLALFAVPPLAALALGYLVRGSRPLWAAAVVPLFALAAASPDSLAGEAAGTLLSGLACVGLGWLLVSVAPAGWLKLGIYAMALIDAWLVGAELLQGPSSVLSAAAPGGLPRLQVADFGSARTGFGDLFVAATLGCLLAHGGVGPGKSREAPDASAHRQATGALLVAVLALAFDLLFFALDTLPATVPVALALALLDRGQPVWPRRVTA